MHPTTKPSRRGTIFDIAVASGVLFFNTITLGNVAPQPTAGKQAFAVTLVVAHSAVLAVRRRAPGAVLGFGIATGLAAAAAGVQLIALGFALPIALYTFASMRPVRASAWALASAEIAMVGAYQVSAETPDLGTYAFNAIALAVVWFLGRTMHERRAYVIELEQRNAELARAREDLAAAAVAEERLRIARELHDVVAHSMSMIAVQSGVGAHVIETQPDNAKRALQAIETASRSALTEMRRVLGLLRDDDGLAPLPGLARLGSLIEPVHAAGVTVTVETEGDLDDLPAALDLAAFRIVQESLTNVVRHANASNARVSLRSDGRRLSVEVRDDGAGAGSLEGGHGITGMRERAIALGGTLEAGPGDGGGFVVTATIPLEAPA